MAKDKNRQTNNFEKKQLEEDIFIKGDETYLDESQQEGFPNHKGSQEKTLNDLKQEVSQKYSNQKNTMDEVNQETNHLDEKPNFYNPSNNQENHQKNLDEKDKIINDLKEKAQEYLSAAQRIQAEFENYRKRNDEIRNCVRFDTACDVINDFLLVLDSIDFALSLIKDQSSADGVILIRKQLISVLEKYDVKEIASIGEDFDPKIHDAIMQEENEEQAGKILEVFKKGYLRKNKVIRYATVKVAI